MPPLGPPSLFGVTVRRSFAVGRFFLGYGIAVSLFLGVVEALSGGTTYDSSFPFLLPIFGVVGSMGALVVFTNDRVKGVLEYLLAYGLSPRAIFANILATALVMVSLVVAVAVGGSLAFYVGTGHQPTVQLAELLLAYGIPMSFATSAFAATVGMYWTALSSPRAGMNSPIGLIPFVGILPSLIALFVLIFLAARGIFSATELLLVAVGVVSGVIVIVLALLAASSRLLRREELLSPA